MSPRGFITAEAFCFIFMKKKNHGNLGAVEHFSHQIPRLNKTPWGCQGAQPQCWSRCAHLTLHFGQQQSWLEQTSRQVQDSNLPTKTDIPGSNSHPHHAQAPSQLPSLSSPWKEMAQIQKLFQDQGVNESWSSSSCLQSLKGHMRQHLSKQEAFG